VAPSSMPSLRVAFGARERYVILWDRNAYAYGPNLERTLIDNIQKLNADGEEIKLVRFIRNGSYFIRSEGAAGIYWPYNMCTSLQQELKQPSKDHGRILDLCVAGDGSWIVIRPDTYVCSNGVHEDVKGKLANFYSSHKARQKKRQEEINDFRVAEQRRKEKEEKEEAATKRSRIDDFLFDVQVKRLKPGVKVTITGVSSSPGDFVVKSVDTAGSVRVGDGHYTDREMLIADPRQITRYDDDELSPIEQEFLLTVSDKYEAAVAMNHCICSENTCHCKSFAPSLTSSYAPAKYCALAAETTSGSTSPRRKPILEYRGEALPFDEYKCAEKIDMNRLERIVKDLTRDSGARSQMLEKLQGGQSMYEQWLTHIQRCSDLEMRLPCTMS
jgi:hypothetical protein